MTEIGVVGESGFAESRRATTHRAGLAPARREYGQSRRPRLRPRPRQRSRRRSTPRRFRDREIRSAPSVSQAIWPSGSSWAASRSAGVSARVGEQRASPPPRRGRASCRLRAARCRSGRRAPARRAHQSRRVPDRAASRAIRGRSLSRIAASMPRKRSSAPRLRRRIAEDRRRSRRRAPRPHRCAPGRGRPAPRRSRDRISNCASCRSARSPARTCLRSADSLRAGSGWRSRRGDFRAR